MVSSSPKLLPPSSRRPQPRSVESSPLPPIRKGSPYNNNISASASSSPEYGNSPSMKPLLLGSSPSNNSTVSMSTNSDVSDGDLPNNISTEAQLTTIPDVCLSGNKQRPLRHVNERGDVSTYSLRPMFFSVIFILLVELLERFSFYGVNYTQTSFLTGEYDRQWNAGMSAIAASSYVSISTAVAYSTPFIGAILADCVFGDYWSILVGAIFFYIPGLLLITLSSVPYLLGETFNEIALAFGLLFLWPLGTGIVKSIVNVFGAKQFHPLLQSSMIESYYVSFYMCINIGALVGGIVVPIVAQHDVTLAYTYPPAMLGIGVMLFLMGTPRYVRHPPAGDLFSSFPWSSSEGGTKTKRKKKNGASTKHTASTAGLSRPPESDQTSLMTIFRVSALVVPFNIAYSQMATTFIIQGTVMKKAFGFIDAASMNNADAVAVLVFGHWVGSYMYPALTRRGIKIPTTYKFALGSGLGALAIAWALYVEHLIHSNYRSSKHKVNIMWQSLSYILIGAGEIFAVSAAYEVAFTASPPEKKALASALNLFCVGGIPNVLCIFLYNACRGWFRTEWGTTSIHALEDYASAQVYKYFLVLFGISVLGIVINLLPSVKNYVAAIEEKAADMVKTPVMKRPTPRMRQRQLQSSASTESSPGITSDDDEGDEESPLLRAQRHQAYLKYGSGPVLYKSGSMRAGPTLGHKDADEARPPAYGAGNVVDGPTKSTKKTLKKSQVGQLYRSSNRKQRAIGGGGGAMVPSQRPSVVMTPEGKPMKAGNIGTGSLAFHNRQGSM